MGGDRRLRGGAALSGKGHPVVPWALPERIAFESLGRAGRPRPVPAARGQVTVTGNLCRLRSDLKDHRWWRQGSLWLRDGLISGLVLDRLVTAQQALAIIESNRDTLTTVTWRLDQFSWNRPVLEALSRIRSPKLCLFVEGHVGALGPVGILGRKLYALWLQSPRSGVKRSRGAPAGVLDVLASLPPLPGLRFLGTDSVGSCYLTEGSLVAGQWSAGACRATALRWPAKDTTGRRDMSVATHVELLGAPSRDLSGRLSRNGHIWSLSAEESGLSAFVRAVQPASLRRFVGWQIEPETVEALVSHTKGLLELGLWGAPRHETRVSAHGKMCPTCLAGMQALALVSNRWLQWFGAARRTMPRLRALLLAGSGPALRTFPAMYLPRLEMLVLDTKRAGRPALRHWLDPFAASTLPFVEEPGQDAVDLDGKVLAAFVGVPIKTLVLRGSHCAGDLGPVIARMSHLEYLDLSGCDGLDSGIVSDLAGLDHLRVLDLAHKKIDSAALSRLSRLKRLEVLNLADNRLDDSSLHWFSAMPNLKVLVVSLNPALTERFLAGLSKVRGLEAVAVAQVGERPLSRWPTLNRKTVRALASLARLQHLDISGWSMDARAMGDLWSLPSLRTLRMDLVRPGALSVDSLPGASRIDVLDLGLAAGRAGSDDEGHAEAFVFSLRKRFSWMTISYDNIPGVVGSALDRLNAARIPAGW